jgi:hypothetical protein
MEIESCHVLPKFQIRAWRFESGLLLRCLGAPCLKMQIEKINKQPERKQEKKMYFYPNLIHDRQKLIKTMNCNSLNLI